MFPDQLQQPFTPLAPTTFFFHISVFCHRSSRNCLGQCLEPWTLKSSIWDCDMIHIYMVAMRKKMIHIRAFWNPIFNSKCKDRTDTKWLQLYLTICFFPRTPWLGRFTYLPDIRQIHFSRHVWPKMGDVGTLWYQLGGYGAIRLKNFNVLVCGLLCVFNDGSHSRQTFLKRNKSHQPPCYHAPAFRTALMSPSRILLPTNLDMRCCL